MMQLNRAVCLDYPEANVPWFHEKYIQERRTGRIKFYFDNKVSYNIFTVHQPNHENVFYLQVYESLLEIAGNTNLILKRIDSPYGYYIDFVVALNKNNEFIDPLNSISNQ